MGKRFDQFTATTTPANADLLLLETDVANATTTLRYNKKITWENIKTLLLGNPSNWTGSFYAQDTAPSSPVADDLWYETDTNLLWTYGTYAAASRWVSVYISTASINNFAGSGSAVQVLQGFGSTGYDVYLNTLTAKYYVATTNDASNYWTFALRKVVTSTAPATGAGSQIGSTLSTQSLTASLWGELSTSLNAVLTWTGASLEYPFFDIIKVSSGGALYTNISVSYRLIHP